jgi:hypothetical protein
MNTYPLPDLAQVRELLGMLFDGLVVKSGAKCDVSAGSGSYAGVYVTDDGTPVALCACNIAFAANSGAALSMLPLNVAKECIKSKELTEVMLGNLREVMNICTRLLMNEVSPHLRLAELCPIKALTGPAAAIIGAAVGRVDFDIGLGKYGNGLLALITL